MANIIKIKRGSGVPASGVLQGYELGYDYTNNSLYLGVAGTDPIKIADAFAGYLSIDTGTGKILASNDFEVDGAITFDGAFTANSSTVFNDAVVVTTGNDLTVQGDTSLVTVTASGLASLDGGIDVAGIMTVDSVTGDIATTGDLTADNAVINGNLTVHGTTTTVNSTVIEISDPIFTLGETLATSDSKDRGIEIKYGETAAPKVGFFGLDESTGRFIFIPDATNTSEVFSGNAGDYEVGEIYQPQTSGVYDAAGVVVNASENWNAAAVALGISGGTGGITTAVQYDVLLADANGAFQPTKTIPEAAGITIDCGTY